MRKISVLGSTGTLGVQALQIIKISPDMEVGALTCHTNVRLLAQQAKEFSPGLVCITGLAASDDVVSLFPKGTQVLFGAESLKFACAADVCETAIIAVVGIAGLPSLYECIMNGIGVALANKEALVCGGSIIRKLLDAHGTHLTPVDSEHSAIFQCLNGTYDVSNVERIILTASGGPFLNWTKEQIETATVEQALNHPNWHMGRKITVDSASLMNKGLEVMEAHWLYKVPADRIDVLVHPQSIVHSMVEFKDASIIAQLSTPNMKLPIQYALNCPERKERAIERLDLSKVSALTFLHPDFDRFPCLKLAYDALKTGDNACIGLNAANEVAVEKFLNHEIPFGRIYEIAAAGTEKAAQMKCGGMQDIFEIDGFIRQFCVKA